LHAQLKTGDARRPADWWDGRPFDAILLDAPCTASGIVRRHPDVRWLRRPGDVDALARVQAELLDALWPLLAPGGHLLYATCSIFKAEGRDQIDAFMQRCPAGAATLGQTLGALALPELGVSVVNLRNRVGHALSVHDTSVLAEGDTLVLSGAPPALALAEERLLRG